MESVPWDRLLRRCSMTCPLPALTLGTPTPDPHLLPVSRRITCRRSSRSFLEGAEHHTLDEVPLRQRVEQQHWDAGHHDQRVLQKRFHRLEELVLRGVER